MSKIKEYVRHLAVVAMATLAAHCAWAALPTTNVISWNVAQDDSNQRNTGLVDTTAESYPTLAGDIPGSCWNQPANYSAEVVVSEFNAETGSARQLTTTFSDYISGGYNIKPDGAETPAYRKAYLARLNNGSVYGQVTINNIPYLKYDLIVYFSGASDVSVYKPLQINDGTYYKGQDGSTVVAASSDTWGDNSATEIAEGTNALVIRGLGNRKLILKNDGVVKNGICAVQIVDRTGTAKSLPIMLFNVYGGGSEVAGWSNVTQSNGASIPSSGALSTNSVSFVAAMPNSNFGGNFAPANACGTDFESGTYVDVFGESHETIAAEVKASLSLPEDVVFDSSIYKTGVINGGYNGQVGTISGLSPDQGYVVYAGFGRKGNDVTYFKMESSGFGSADSIDYVTTVARTSGNVTVKATEYTEYTVGSMIGPGSTDGLLLVRMANVKPNADGNIVFSLGGGRSGLNWVAVAKVNIQTVAKIGNKNFSSLSAALAAAEAATSEEGKVISLLAPHTGNVSIASGVTIEMDVNNRITGTISGAGTVKLSHSSTATQGSLTTWIGDGKMTFAEFTGTVHLAAGRFNATTALVPATAKVKVTNGAQLFVDGGTWTNTIELEGAGYGNETTHIGRAALRFEQGNIDGATIESNATGDNAPAIGSYGSDRIFAFKLIGTGDIRLVLGSGSHTYKFTNEETTLSGTVTIVDANLTLEAEVSEGEDEFPNDIAGAGTLKKSGEGALTLSGNVTCAVKLAAGTIVSETVTGEVTTDVAGKHVAFDEETNTYSLADNKTPTELFLEAIAAGGDVELTGDVTLETTAVIPADKAVTLDLNSCTITAPKTAISVLGTLTVKDTGTNGKIVSTGNCGIAVGDGATLTVNSGIIESVEGAIITGTSVGATITINGGTFSASDNAVIAGNGTAREGDRNMIKICGGTFNGSIKSPGYIACGIYSPWQDFISVQGGTFNITGGCVFCARAGVIQVEKDVTINLDNEGTASGWVGDNKNVIPGVQAYFDYAAKYPGFSDGDAIISRNKLSIADTQEWVLDKDGRYYMLVDKTTGPKEWSDVTESTTLDQVAPAEQVAALTAAGATAKQVAAWATKVGIDGKPGVTLDLDAFALDCSPSAKQQTVENEVPSIDMAELAKGNLDEAVKAISAKYYPLADVQLVEATLPEGTVTTAKLYKLVISLKK